MKYTKKQILLFEQMLNEMEVNDDILADVRDSFQDEDANFNRILTYFKEHNGEIDTSDKFIRRTVSNILSTKDEKMAITPAQIYDVIKAFLKKCINNSITIKSKSQRLQPGIDHAHRMIAHEHNLTSYAESDKINEHILDFYEQHDFSNDPYISQYDDLHDLSPVSKRQLFDYEIVNNILQDVYGLKYSKKKNGEDGSSLKELKNNVLELTRKIEYLKNKNKNGEKQDEIDQLSDNLRQLNEQLEQIIKRTSAIDLKKNEIDLMKYIQNLKQHNTDGSKQEEIDQLNSNLEGIQNAEKEVDSSVFDEIKNEVDDFVNSANDPIHNGLLDLAKQELIQHYGYSKTPDDFSLQFNAYCFLYSQLSKIVNGVYDRYYKAILAFFGNKNNYPDDEKEINKERIFLDKETIKNNEDALNNGTLFDTVYKDDVFMQKLFKYVQKMYGFSGQLSNEQKKLVQDAIVNVIEKYDRPIDFEKDTITKQLLADLQEYEKIQEEIMNGKVLPDDDFSIKKIMEKIVAEWKTIDYYDPKVPAETKSQIEVIEQHLEELRRHESYVQEVSRILKAINNANMHYKKIDPDQVVDDLFYTTKDKNGNDVLSFTQPDGFQSKWKICPAIYETGEEVEGGVMVDYSKERERLRQQAQDMSNSRWATHPKHRRSTSPTGFNVELDDPNTFIMVSTQPDEKTDKSKLVKLGDEYVKLMLDASSSKFAKMTPEERQKYIEYIKRMDHEYITKSMNKSLVDYDVGTAMQGKTGFEDDKWETHRKISQNMPFASDKALKKAGVEADPVAVKIQTTLDSFFRNYNDSDGVDSQDKMEQLKKKLMSLSFSNTRAADRRKTFDINHIGIGYDAMNSILDAAIKSDEANDDNAIDNEETDEEKRYRNNVALMIKCLKAENIELYNQFRHLINSRHDDYGHYYKDILAFFSDKDNYPKNEKETNIKRIELLDKELIKTNERALVDGTLFDTVYKNDVFMQNLFKYVQELYGFPEQLTDEQKKIIQDAIVNVIEKYGKKSNKYRSLDWSKQLEYEKIAKQIFEFLKDSHPDIYDELTSSQLELRPPLSEEEAELEIERYFGLHPELRIKITKQQNAEQKKRDEEKNKKEKEKELKRNSSSQKNNQADNDNSQEHIQAIANRFGLDNDTGGIFEDLHIDEDEDEKIAESINDIFMQSAIYDYIEECMNTYESLNRNACVNGLVRCFNITPNAANKQIDDFFNNY